MATWRDYLTNEGYEKLSEAKNYSEILSLDDPEDDPFRSFYIARDNYNAVKSVLKKSTDKCTDDDGFCFVVAALELRIGEWFVSLFHLFLKLGVSLCHYEKI